MRVFLLLSLWSKDASLALYLIIGNHSSVSVVACFFLVFLVLSTLVLVFFATIVVRDFGCRSFYRFSKSSIFVFSLDGWIARSAVFIICFS